MTAHTPTYQWPYPTPAEPSDGPFAFQSALEAVESSVTGKVITRLRPGTLFAGSMPAGDPNRTPVIQGGQGSYTTNAAGQFAVIFPSAFPNAVLALMAQPNSNFRVALGVPASTTLTTGVWVAYQVGASGGTVIVPNAAVTFSWLAIGC